MCMILFHSLRLQDLLIPSSFQCLQANTIHLIQEDRQETRVYTVGSLTR